jgi:hypothetical protein
MSLDDYANLADIVAVLLVIASLLYVGRQLKQTTDMMRVSASNERVQREYEILDNLIENREVAEYWLKGESDFDALDAVDQQRLLFFERRAIILWHHMFTLRQQQLIPDADWQWNEWVIRNVGRRQAVRRSWAIFGGSFEKPFRDYIERQFAAADGGQPAAARRE